MKEMNELETQLGSWALRRPSARLESRLFTPTPPLCEENFHLAFRWARVAPSAIGLVLVCLLLSQWNSPSFSYQTSSVLLGFPSFEHSAANHIARVSGTRNARLSNILDMNTESVTSGITGMVFFPLLHTTNH